MRMVGLLIHSHSMGNRWMTKFVHRRLHLDVEIGIGSWIYKLATSIHSTG